MATLGSCTCNVEIFHDNRWRTFIFGVSELQQKPTSFKIEWPKITVRHGPICDSVCTAKWTSMCCWLWSVHLLFWQCTCIRVHFCLKGSHPVSSQVKIGEDVWGESNSSNTWLIECPQLGKDVPNDIFHSHNEQTAPLFSFLGMEQKILLIWHHNYILVHWCLILVVYSCLTLLRQFAPLVNPSLIKWNKNPIRSSWGVPCRWVTGRQKLLSLKKKRC